MANVNKARALYYAAKLYRDGAAQLIGVLPREESDEVGRCTLRIMDILNKEHEKECPPAPTVTQIEKDDGGR